MALKIRRGTDAERITIVPAEGELIYTTDTKKVYIGDNVTTGGNIVNSTLPPGPYSNGQVLSVDTQGNLSWSTIELADSTIRTSDSSNITVHNYTQFESTVEIDGSLKLNHNILDDTGSHILFRAETNQNEFNLYRTLRPGTTAGNDKSAFMNFYNEYPNYPHIRAYTSRGTLAAPAASSLNDVVFSQLLFGHGPDRYHRAVSVLAIADGPAIQYTSGLARMPGRYVITVGRADNTSDHTYTFDSKGTLTIPQLRVASTLYTSSPDTRPGVGVRNPGMIIFDGTTSQFQGWNGTAWVTLG